MIFIPHTHAQETKTLLLWLVDGCVCDVRMYVASNEESAIDAIAVDGKIERHQRIKQDTNTEPW